MSHRSRWEYFRAVYARYRHQNIRVTEKHYAPWVRARQEQLEADVRRTWTTDLVASAEAKATAPLQ